jgi:trimeric autotransporter adhesin
MYTHKSFSFHAGSRIASLLCLTLLLSVTAFSQVRIVADLGKTTFGTPEQKGFSLHRTTLSRSFFVADNTELWTSDGTAAGTIIIKRFLLIKDLELVNGVLFISATTQDHGCELWKSDGTTSGTVRVKDIFPGAGSANPLDLTNMNGILYFSANGGPTGRELWRSDGTMAGTQLVKDIQIGSASSAPAKLVVVGSRLFFVANDGTAGYELWVSNGTPAGTVLIKDIYPDAGKSSVPDHLVSSNGQLIFSADAPSIGRQLWRSDGTAAGTTLIRIIRGGGYPTNIDKLTDVNGVVFFQGQDGSHGIELWRTDGTGAGTYMVKDITPGSGSYASYGDEHIDHLAAINGKLFFTASASDGPSLWVSDGTEAGTREVVPYSQIPFTWLTPDFTEFNGACYFLSYNWTDNSITLFKSDGTSTGTILVRSGLSENIGTNPMFKKIGSKLFFFENELFWKTDGTTAGTTIVRRLGYPAGIFPNQLTDVGGTLYFRSSGEPQGLWKSNGTAETTVKFSDEQGIFLQGTSNLLYFSAAPPNNYFDFKAYRSDGTAEGTFMLHPESNDAENFTEANNLMFFTAAGEDTGAELWQTDGTVAGTKVTKDINPGATGSSPTSLIRVGNNLFFSAWTEVYGTELWKSNGTAAGTYLVKDIYPGATSSISKPPQAASGWVSFNGELFFQANDGTTGKELWRSNGTPEGTAILKDIRTSDIYDADIGNMVATQNRLLFTAKDETGKISLWASTGESSGTSKIKEFETNELGNMIAATPTQAYFVLYLSGAMELWRTNGTASGTVRLKKFNDQHIKYPGKVAVLGEVAYFSLGHANSASTTIWRTDGTAAGTYSIRFDGIATDFTTSGPYVYFVGLSHQYGSELFVMDEASAAAAGTLAEVVEPFNLNDSAYPNPFRQEFTIHIRGNENEKFALNVFSLNGQNVVEEAILSCNVDHKFGNTWQSGMYILKVRRNDKVTITKMIRLKD